jgi:deoxyribodipyrimidine photolyase-related protein
MATGIWLLGDQLWTGQAALSSCETTKKQTPVILIESRNYARQRPYHCQKLVLIWSAMRHLAEELRSAGWSVTYEIADDFQTPLKDWINNHKITEVRLMNPNDRPFFQLIKKLELGCPIRH